MKSNKRSHRFMLATLALGVGAWVLLHGHQLKWLQYIDHIAVQTVTPAENPLHEHDSQSGSITVSSLITNPKPARGHQLVFLSDDPERIFESTPPSALDYAVILESLHNRGYRHINISTRLNWNEEPGLLAEGLDLRLSLFESAVIPLAVTQGPSEGTMPAMLENALIRPQQIHGNHHLIPMVNRTTLAPQLKGNTKGLLAGFHLIESNPPAANHIAMLARWSHKGMIPSYELLTIMQAHNISPDAVQVHCGKHIRLGKHGPIITIDDYGQATPPPLSSPIQSPQTTPEPLLADTIITQKKSNTPHNLTATIHATGKRTSSTNAIPTDRLNKALAMAYAFPIEKNSTILQRLPLWAEFILIFDLSLIAFLLRNSSRACQHLGFILATVSLLPLLYTLVDISQHWMPVSAPLAVLLVAWLFPYSSRRSTSAMPEYHTTSPKPVIRA